MSTTQLPAWRHSGFWLVFGLLFGSVIVSLIMVYLSLHGRDVPVVADAYDRGLDINEQLARDAKAHQLNLHADLHYDAMQHVLFIQFLGTSPLQAQDLNLRLPHPIDPHQDVNPHLQSLGGQRYAAVLPADIHGHHYILLSTHDWRLVGNVDFPFTHATLSAP